MHWILRFLPPSSQGILVCEADWRAVRLSGGKCSQPLCTWWVFLLTDHRTGARALSRPGLGTDTAGTWADPRGWGLVAAGTGCGVKEGAWGGSLPHC